MEKLQVSPYSAQSLNPVLMIDTVQQQFDSVQQQFDTQQGVLDEHANQLSSQESRLDQLALSTQGQIENLHTALDQTRDNLADSDARIVELHSALNRLKSELDSFQDTIYLGGLIMGIVLLMLCICFALNF